MLILWCVLIAALMPVVCAGIAKWGSFGKRRRDGGYDNHDPRDWLAKQQGFRNRANAAQANCFEALPFFIGALVLAQQMQAPVSTVQLLAAIFVALRAVYVGLYLADLPMARSLVWMSAVGVNIALLFAGA
jgi:uncharacterized MAPEG superfamily protein